MKKADFLAECLRRLDSGEDLQDCLSLYPRMEQELRQTLSTWQMLQEAMPEWPAHLPVSREAFYMQIARQKSRHGLPLAIKFAVVAEVASLASLVLLPETAYGLILSLCGSVAWLSWWVTSFLPRLLGLRAHSSASSYLKA